MRKVKNLQKVPFPAPDVVTKVIPAPTGGWDAISPLASMDPKRAPILDNWVPRPGWVELRAGYTPWVISLDTVPVESLMIYRSSLAQKMFAACGTAIYDVSTIASPTTELTGLTNARWQYVNFRPAGGTAVIQCVNGQDTLKQYDGSSWTTPSITGFPGGLLTSDIVNIYAQKRRLWYLMKNTTIAAFMPTDAVSGAIAGYLDLGALWTKGGYLVSMSDWTVDGGNGPQDYAVFISSRGQASIYSGTDPTSSTAWTLVGTFDLPPPIGYRCMTKVGSDIGLISLQGVLPISQALPFDPSADRSVAITARIQNAMAQASSQASSNFGWELISFPAQQLAILNVPLVENQSQVQFIMNALTGAWCRFTGWNANCFAIFNEDLFWGGNNGDIYMGYSGSLDGIESIVADMQCAFNYFDDPGRTKRMTMVQPLIVAGGTLSPAISVDEDFGTSTTSATLSILTGGALWDVAVWDSDVWPVATQTVVNWLSVQAIGHALAVHLQVNIGASPYTLTGYNVYDFGVFDTAVFDGSTTTSAQVLQVNAFNGIMELGGFI